MKKSLLFIPFILLISLFFVSCEKEYSIENGGVPSGGGPNPAVFTFSGGTAACTGALVTGTYKVGTATSSGNTVSLNLFVDSVGTYNITTGALNGVTFSGSGSLTGTGLQTVTLTASGTPTSAGDFNYTAGTGGCTFTITVASNSGSSGGTAVYTFDGSPATCTGATVNGTYTAGTATGSGNTVQLNVTVTTAGTYDISTTSNDGITFSGTGTFAGTGPQTVTLTASGTPSAQGDYNFTAGAAGCVFSVTVAPGSTSGTDYIRCKIDGVDKTFNDGALGVDIFGLSLAINGSENAASSTTGNFSITLTNLTGTIDAGTYTINLLGKNCMIVYVPDASSSSTAWATATASQPGGFTVELTENTATRASGTFSGTLYDNNGNGTNTKSITNGEFSVPK